VAQQLALFSSGERILVRTVDARVIYVPEVFTSAQSATYFERLRDEITWDETTMWMYDREVDVPRLTAYFNSGDELPALLVPMLAEMRLRFEVPFNGVGLNLYRDGRDSVAWHSDRNEHLIPDPTIAIVSLGETRTMLVRPVQPPRHAVSCDLEPGSALVMHGRAQERFEHCIPKITGPAGPRISVVFRTRIAT
jgi:alkylated DNA repair dioxygenase AlkB